MPAVQPHPPTQYTRSGDLYLAYQVLGDGPQTLLFIPGFISHLELMWEEPGVAAFLHRLARGRRLILFDKRGTGLSDRVGSPPTTAETMDDMLAVLNAAGCRTADLLAVSEGGPSAILFAATYPNRTARLILYGTMAKFTRSFDYPWALSRSQYDDWLEHMLANWGTAVSLHIFAPSVAHDPAFRDWWARLLRQAATPGSVKGVLEALRDIDVREALPHVQVPSLVLHRRGDKAIPIAGGRYLAQNLPHGRLVELSGQDHWWWVGDAPAVLDEIDRFLAVDEDQDGSGPAAGPPAPAVEPLTGRELDVLRLIAAGYTNQQIADELVLTLGTVKTYSSHIYGKLGVTSRTEAVSAARKQGLVR
jgi:pimeloyl-ACP methyl ester carboxylesterase/DNA-binding CsgD family transcriptional regulator